MIDIGRGPAVVIIPGIQGRWEWMKPAVTALSRRHRVLSFSLGDANGSSPFEDWDLHIDRLLDRAGVGRAAIVGVSFGGLVAVHYTARHQERIRALVLVSTPAPDWQVTEQDLSYVRHPLRSAIPFAIRGLVRLVPEVIASAPNWPGRVRLLFGHVSRVLGHPVSPRSMAAWIRAWQSNPTSVACESIRVPTLVVTGEPHLDRVVPTSSTLRYVDLIRGARHARLAGTGHIGLICKPDDFAGVVGRFLNAPDD
jgi:pimeloyl-ACP methyl ester carboxylesterase